MVSIPTVNLALTGANFVSLRKAAGLTVHDLQAAFGFNSNLAHQRALSSVVSSGPFLSGCSLDTENLTVFMPT